MPTISLFSIVLILFQQASKLRAVIVDCERRVEEFKEQHNEAQLDRERSHLELEQLIQDNIRYYTKNNVSIKIVVNFTNFGTNV